MHILAELTPLDPVAGTRATLRASSAQDRTITGLNGQQWWPAISQLPTLTIRLFDGDFSSAVDPGSASLTLQEDVLEKANANARRMLWAGATVKLYAGASGQAWPWTMVFQGVVDSFERRANRLKISANVDVSPFQANVLTATYAGTGGSAGGADLKGKPKPYLAGRALNVEPVLIDATNSVFQFHGYGSIQAVNALYERASDFGASIGDYASYAALVAATIPPGRWATCLAEGMVRLGAPPYGVITGDVDGDKPSGAWIRKTGAIINRVCALAGVSGGVIDSASLTALDTAVARNINIYLVDQMTVLDLAQRLARPCNAQAGVSMLGKLFVARVGIGSPALTLDAQGKRLPAVQDCVESDVSPPYARMQMEAARSWRVHSFDEIATSTPLVDRGDYDNAATYREGNIVSLTDGSRYEYINATPSAGHAPPNATYWAPLQDGPVVDFASQVTGPQKPADNADVTADQPIVSRLNEANGQALSTFISADGRTFTKVAAVGEARDGDMVSFAATMPSVPKIVFLPGGNAATAGQNIAITAEGLTTSGFTMKAKSQSVTPGSTITDTGSTAGGGGNPDRVIDRTNGGAPFDGKFVFRFSVTVGNIAPGEPGYVQIALYVKQSGAWHEVGGGSYSTSGTYDLAATPGAVDFGAGAEFGVSLVAAEGSGSALSGFTHVKYTLGTVTETSLTPSGASAIPWLAVLQ